MGGGTVRYLAFALALGLAGEVASAARVVDPSSARQSIANSAIVAVDAEISALAADGRATDLAARLDLIAHDRTITDVAQEWLLDRGLHALARLEPTPRSRETVLRLLSRTPIVYTQVDPDHGDRATPLYDTAATARFVLRNWDRNAARKAAEADLAAGRPAVVERFAGRAGQGGQDAVRAGIADAFRRAAPAVLSAQRATLVEALTAGRPVDELALIAAERLADAELFDLVFGFADERVALAAVPAVARSARCPDGLRPPLDCQPPRRYRLRRRARDRQTGEKRLPRRASSSSTRSSQRDVGPSAAAALAALDDPTVAAELGRRLAKSRSEESRRLIVLALRLDASPAAQEELGRFAASKQGSAELQKETRQWLER